MVEGQLAVNPKHGVVLSLGNGVILWDLVSVGTVHQTPQIHRDPVGKHVDTSYTKWARRCDYEAGATSVVDSALGWCGIPGARDGSDVGSEPSTTRSCTNY